MKVMCINTIRLSYDINFRPILTQLIDDVVVGEIYTVVHSEFVIRLNRLFYELKEKGPDELYSADLFAPISEIEETEFERNYNTQTA